MQSESIEDIPKPSSPNHPQHIPSTLQHGIHNRASASPDGSYDRDFHGQEEELSPDNGGSDANSSFDETPDLALSSLTGPHEDSISFHDVSRESTKPVNKNAPDNVHLKGRQKRLTVLITDLPNGTLMNISMQHLASADLCFQKS
jgi:hypothetical protein